MKSKDGILGDRTTQNSLCFLGQKSLLVPKITDKQQIKFKHAIIK